MDIFKLLGVNKDEIFAMLAQAKATLDEANARLSAIQESQARQEIINQRIAAALVALQTKE